MVGTLISQFPNAVCLDNLVEWHKFIPSLLEESISFFCSAYLDELYWHLFLNKLGSVFSCNEPNCSSTLKSFLSAAKPLHWVFARDNQPGSCYGVQGPRSAQALYCWL